MRIAIFTETFLPKIDGITNRLRHTIAELVDQGHQVRVFGPATSVPRHAGADVIKIPGLPYPPYPELRVALPHPRIAWELTRFRPDVVHAVGPVALGTWGVVTARALGLPIVASYHTDFPSYVDLHGLGFAKSAVWPVMRWIHNRAEINLCPSRHTREELEQNGIRNVEIWRGGVDTRLFDPGRRDAAMRARLSAGDVDAPLIVTAARLAPEKSIDHLKDVLEAIPEARLAVVGDGPARADLERTFASLPVVFTGFLRGEALARAFASGDLFVVPSTTETLGFVVLEAMASGQAVVAADAGGIPDLIRSGEDGILYDPSDRSALVESVEALLFDRTRRRFMGEQARKSAERASWARETRDLAWVYRRAIKAHRTGGLLRRLRHALRG